MKIVKIVKMPLSAVASVLAILAALLFAQPAAGQIAPTITAQPESVSTGTNGAATFTVSFAGSTTLVSDWYLGGKYVFGNTNFGLLAATNSLVFANVLATNAGSYIVVITNDWGRITSSVVALTITNAPIVTNPPAILLQPKSIFATNGATVTFNVIASGSTNMVADWYFNGQYVSGITNQGTLMATNSLVLSDLSTTNAGSYVVVITNDWGSITSSVATLTIVPYLAPAILLQPQSAFTTNGASVTFDLIVSGSPNTVADWFLNGHYVSGSTNQGVFTATNSLVLPDVNPTNSGFYMAVITNDWGSITSSVVTLAITNLPQISIPASASGAVMVNLLITPGASSRLWLATNLCPPVIWMPVATNMSGTNGLSQFTDTNNNQYPVRFYRTSTP